MNSIFEIVKFKGRSLQSFHISGKRYCSANSCTFEEKHCLPNLGTLKIIPPKKNVATVVKNTPNTQNKAKWEKSFVTKNISVVKNKNVRKNVFNIQMLSESLYSQIFKNIDKSRLPDPKLIQKAKLQLVQFNLWKDNVDYLEDVSLNLPPLKGKNIEEHFWIIGEEQCKPYRDLVSSFIKIGIPNYPSKWLCQKGWTKYVEGEEPVMVPFPDEDILIFDVEVTVKLGELPVIATAVSSNAWYGWVCPDLANGINSVPTDLYNTSKLIPFEGKSYSKEKPRIIIGHNVSYDRARIKEQYYLKSNALRFLDTMSLHICIGGTSKNQKTLLKQKSEDFETNLIRDLCLCSLRELYNLYCQKELLKTPRNVFLEGSMADVRDDFQNLMTYCSNDVKATYEVLQAIFPTFLKRFPHPVTLAGMLEMGSAFLTVNSNWNKFLSESDQTYEDLKSELSSILSKKCDNACKLFHNEQYKKDLWMWSEDWTTQKLKLTKKKLPKKMLPRDSKNFDKCQKEKEMEEEEEDKEEKDLKSKFQYLYDLRAVLPKNLPFLPGYPLWYRKLCDKSDSTNCDPIPKLSTSMIVASKLLNLTWEDFPLYYCKEFGWGILIPDIFAENVVTAVPFERLKELTLRNCSVDLNKLRQKMKENVKYHHKDAPYYNGSGVWCNHIVDNCCFFYKIPHKLGPSNNVGNPLSKNTAHLFYNGFLRSQDPQALKVLDLGPKLSYWRNNRDRIRNQMVVWLNKKEASLSIKYDEDNPVGVILPQVVVCGTLTRRAMEPTWLTASKSTENRIGSELLSMIQAPPGYHFVGADVDSQEWWIASLIGDSYFAKEHGCTPFGWMTLRGTKAAGTDMHSVTAKAIGISRSDAKVINYARIYGAGVRFAQKLLKQSNPSLSDEEAFSKAEKMYNFTKGRKEYKLKKSIRVKPDLEKTAVDNLASAVQLAKCLKKKMEDLFERGQWVGGTESAVFNRLEKIAMCSKPVTPFLQCRLSKALEPRFEGDDLHLITRLNWVVQSGAVDFLHLMLVAMKWLTNGKARYCFSFHDEVRYLIPSEDRYSGALALHITNLLVRSFCSHRLGIYDLPQSVAFFSSVEVDKTLRKEAFDDCITPSNPQGIEKGYGIAPGESLNIYQAIQKSGGTLSPFGTQKKREMSEATKRKHVLREVLQGELVPPKDNQLIVKVLANKGSNLHEVISPESKTFLVSMPNKFRKNVWIKRGDYILVESSDISKKVKAEIVAILTPDYIKFLKKENLWPDRFSQKEEKSPYNLNNDFFEYSNRKTIASDKEFSEDDD